MKALYLLYFLDFPDLDLETRQAPTDIFKIFLDFLDFLDFLSLTEFLVDVLFD